MNMKKSLLIAVAALFVAVNVSAQKPRVLPVTKCYSHVATQTQVPTTMSAPVMPKAHQSVSKSHRAATEGIAGDYILNAVNFEEDFTESSMFSISEESGTIQLDQYKDNPSFEYNVVLNDFTYTGAKVYGFYNAEEAHIEIPVQTIFVHSTYKEIVLTGGYRKDAENLGLYKELILNVNEDGTLDVYEDYDETDPEDHPTTGFVSVIPNYEDGSLWSYGFDLNMMKPNATLTFITNNANFDGVYGEPDENGWYDAELRVYVDDYESQFVVSNFLGMSTVDVTVDGPNVCSIKLGQEVEDYDYKNYDADANGRLRLVGVSYSGGNGLTRDATKEYLNGFYSDNRDLLWFAKYVKNDEGKLVVSHDDNNYCPYFVITTDPTATKVLGIGWFGYPELVLDSYSDPSGISEVNTANKTATAKTYNMLGQQVNAGAKGLLIRDGKKFIAK